MVGTKRILFGAVILIALLVIGWLRAHTPQYNLPIIVSAILTGIAWLVAGQNMGTFRGTTVAFFAAMYPLSALLNSLLPASSLPPRLWAEGVIGLWGYCVGIVGLTAGFIAIERLSLGRRRKSEALASGYLISFSWDGFGKRLWFLVGVFAVVSSLAFLGAFYGGYYFHEVTDFASARVWFFMGYFKYLAFALSTLLLEYYLATKAIRGLLAFGATIVIDFLFLACPEAEPKL